MTAGPRALLGLPGLALAASVLAAADARPKHAELDRGIAAAESGAS